MHFNQKDKAGSGHHAALIRFLGIALLVSAGACNDSSSHDSDDVQLESTVSLSRGEIEGRTFEAVETNAMRPSFTENTVIKLNSIVRRSLHVANEYTGSIRSLRETVDAASKENANKQQKQNAQKAISILDNWHSRALNAQNDMNVAVAQLQDSDEVYNEEILTGMRRYVDGVEQLIRKENTALKSKMEN